VKPNRLKVFTPTTLLLPGLLLALEAEGIDLSDRHVPSAWLSFDERRPGELY
jgi:hypothetical protein